MEIRFKTDKLAQSLGYSNIKSFTKQVRREYVDHKGNGIGEYYYKPTIVNEHVKPKQSELQAWLREKYNIDIIIYRSFSMKKSYHYSIIIDCNYDDEIQQTCIPDRSYEESLEEGLLESLTYLSKILFSII